MLVTCYIRSQKVTALNSTNTSGKQIQETIEKKQSSSITSPKLFQAAWDFWRFTYWRIGSLTCKREKVTIQYIRHIALSLVLHANSKTNQVIQWKEFKAYSACFSGSLFLTGPTADNCIRLIIVICVSICSAVLGPWHKTLSWSYWLHIFQSKLLIRWQRTKYQSNC